MCVLPNHVQIFCKKIINFCTYLSLWTEIIVVAVLRGMFENVEKSAIDLARVGDRYYRREWETVRQRVHRQISRRYGMLGRSANFLQ